MNKIYVFDACSLIALLTNEEGADVVKDLLQKALDAEIKVIIHKINFFEVYYDTYKTYGEEKALKLLEDIKVTPMKINSEITDDILVKAGRLKSLYKISLADSIGLAESMINNGHFVTADHHELEVIQEKENINIFWFREKRN